MLQYAYVTHHLLLENQPEVPRMAADGSGRQGRQPASRGRGRRQRTRSSRAVSGADHTQ